LGSVVSWKDVVRVQECRTSEEVPGCPCSFPGGWWCAGYGRAMGLWCRICVGKCGCCCWPVPSLGPKTEWTCTCPSPGGWFRAGCCWYMSASVGLSIGLSKCRGHYMVAWFVLTWVTASVAAPRGWCCPIHCSGVRARPVCTCPSSGGVCHAVCGRAVDL